MTRHIVTLNRPLMAKFAEYFELLIGLLALPSPKKLPGLRFQRHGYSFDIVDGNISLRALDRAEVRPVYSAFERECFLAQREFGASQPHVFGQDISQTAFVRPFHSRTLWRAALLRRPLLSYIP